MIEPFQAALVRYLEPAALFAEAGWGAISEGSLGLGMVSVSHASAATAGTCPFPRAAILAPLQFGGDDPQQASLMVPLCPSNHVLHGVCQVVGFDHLSSSGAKGGPDAVFQADWNVGQKVILYRLRGGAQ